MLPQASFQSEAADRLEHDVKKISSELRHTGSALAGKMLEGADQTVRLVSKSKALLARTLIPPRGEHLMEVERRIKGQIDSSFVRSAKKAGVPETLINKFVDLFSDRVDFRKDLAAGDSFAIIYSERQGKTPGKREAASIKAASLLVRDKLYAAIRYVDSQKNEHYLDEEGHELGDFFLRFPIKFTRITSVFAEERFHPVLMARRPHNGVDFAAPMGTPVRSTADGVITVAGFNPDAGLQVRIKHANGYSTCHFHLGRLAEKIKAGKRVARGQLIGTVGLTGLTTGPHLHFGLFKNGRFVDPLKAKLPYSGLALKRREHNEFSALLASLKQEHRRIAAGGARSPQA